MDLFEGVVYLVVIIAACLTTFGTMWLLTRSMARVRPLTKKEIDTLKAKGVTKIPKYVRVKAVKRPKEKQTGSAKEKGKGKEKNKEKGKDQVTGGNDDSLPPLKEMANDRLLPEMPAGDASKKDRKAADDKADSKGASPAPAEEQPAEIAEIALPDLPTMDTLVEGEEETPEQQNIEELMSVFELEEVEDSATSDLAANLFDVDVNNIENLGSEISEFLNGMRRR